jgi:hypothetical protein
VLLELIREVVGSIESQDLGDFSERLRCISSFCLFCFDSESLTMKAYSPEAPGVRLGVAKLELHRHELTKISTDLVWFTDSVASCEAAIR